MTAGEAGIERFGSPVRSSLVELARRRYPTALPFVRAASDEELSGWAFPPASALSRRLEGFAEVDGFLTVVYEGAHVWTGRHSGFETMRLMLHRRMVLQVPDLRGFALGALLAMHPRPDEDGYAGIYLFNAPDRDLDVVLNELNAYTHGLAADYCLLPLRKGVWRSTSRDGVLTFLAYLEMYLHKARTEYPSLYRDISSTPERVQAVMLLRQRALFWLHTTRAEPGLAALYESIVAWAGEPESMKEVELLRRSVLE